jgi:predicted transcriptional regulator
MERRSAVFAVRPTFARALIAGSKRFEFRRVRPALDRGDIIFVYSTSPEKAIVGTFMCGQILEGKPLGLWNRLRNHAGTSRRHFLEYFADADVAFAIEATSPIAWSEPLSLARIRKRLPGFNPPQSYRYILETDSLGQLISAHSPL